MQTAHKAVGLAVSLVPVTPVTPVTPVIAPVAPVAPVLNATFGGGCHDGFNEFNGFNFIGGGNLGAITPNGVMFTISNGAVTGEQRVIGTQTFSLNLPANATFAVDGAANTVTETLTGTNATKVDQFTLDPTSPTLYHMTSEVVTFTNPTTTSANGSTNGYSFTIANGSVTAMQEVSSHISYNGTTHTRTESETLSPTASFSVSGSTVTETSVQGNTIEILQFVASGTSGLYAVASETTTFIQPGAATTLLSVSPFDRAKFSLDASGNVTQVQHVSPNGTVTTATPNTYTAFSQLAPGFVLETVTLGTRSAYEVYNDGNGDGIYTAVAHGQGVTVDLVGLKAQLSADPHILQVT